MANIRKSLIGVFIVMAALFAVVFSGCNLIADLTSSPEEEAATYTIIRL